MRENDVHGARCAHSVVCVEETATSIPAVNQTTLPKEFRPLFWDYPRARLEWGRDRDLIINRLLSTGGWEAVRWLRQHLGDAELRRWLEGRAGAGLSPRQLRYWELILGLPRREVNAWLAAPGRAVWDGRRRS